MSILSKFKNFRMKTKKKLSLRNIFLFIVTLFLLYIVGGFLLLPFVAKQVAIGIIEDKFGVEPKIESICFNPFSFKVEINDLIIPERIELGKFKLDLEIWPIFRKQIKLKYIYLGDTKLTLSLAKDGKTNWTPISEEKTPELIEPEDNDNKEGDDDSSPVHILIDDITLENIYTTMILEKAPAGTVKKVKKEEGAKNNKTTGHKKKAFPIELEKSPSEIVDLVISKFSIVNNELHIIDNNINPSFKTGLVKLNGVISPVTLSPQEKINLDINAVMEKHGKFTLNGFIVPNHENPTLDLGIGLNNLIMTIFTPYSGKFTGYEVNKGKLFLRMNYNLKDLQLSGSNNVVLDQFTLGKEVKSKDATNLPVKLILALIKDGDGRIKMNVPVKGDVSSPEFSLGGAIWTAVHNILINIITSPFSFLGGIFGGGDDVDSIYFQEGKAILAPDQDNKFKGISKAMAERPGLMIEILGAYKPSDAEALGKDTGHSSLKSLAAKRAHLVQDALISNKVPSERIYLLSETKLEEDNKSPRVLIILKAMD